MIRRNEISTKTLAYLDELLCNYTYYNKRIREREFELQERKEIDENVGGGRSSQIGKPTESIAIKFASDSKLAFAYKCKESAEYTRAYTGFNDDEVKVMEEKYFKNNGSSTWDYIASSCKYASSSVYRMRYKILEVFGNKLGVINTLDL